MVATTAEQPFTIAKIPISSWTFAIRVWLAMILALFVSFWLQLEAPASAAVTVGILAEPTRGQALDKAGFRLLGTIVGVTASIAITGLFSQARDLILAAFAVWIRSLAWEKRPVIAIDAVRPTTVPSNRKPALSSV